MMPATRPILPLSSLLLVLTCALLGCSPDASNAAPARPASAPAPRARSSVAREPTRPLAASSDNRQPQTRPAADAAPEGPPATAAYPWHADRSIKALPAAASLRQRFAAEPGYQRVKLPAASFGAWLRELPLAPEGTPVRAYNGGLLLAADDPHIAAVSTLDTGDRDLQQCADAVMRLHAEWLWHSGRADEASYQSGAGAIAWRRYQRGGFPKPKGNSFVWGQRSARNDDHPTYRNYLDVVFSWSNTVALQRQASKVPRAELRPGDFFVQPGSPGHTVLILDVAQNAAGERIALLGQSYMPAQSFQVLRPSRAELWFKLNAEDGVKTPFWPRFSWDSLRRLD